MLSKNFLIVHNLDGDCCIGFPRMRVAGKIVALARAVDLTGVYWWLCGSGSPSEIGVDLMYNQAS